MSIQTEFPGMKRDRGFMYERTQWGGFEKVFADRWEEENEVRPWLNQGCGLLQNLFFNGHWPFEKCMHVVTPSERFVAATVVQWLGTNCGMGFLQGVLREEGYYIAKIPEQHPLFPERPKPGPLLPRKFA